MEHVLYNLTGFVSFVAIVFSLGREWQKGAPRREQMAREIAEADEARRRWEASR